ncbi:hypothetical protein B0H13DRAFT_2656274 [Mycena leptocephala]|nr:hypothetical protein B0H13DRAFT_2656274 [Mycena leptocephala]
MFGLSPLYQRISSSCTEPNYDTDPPTEFATGVGHDTTYRNMNKNRAPLTIMITLDENGRMVPGFAYLSADIKIPTQVAFLQETKRLVEMAADLVAGRVPVAAGLEDGKEELMANARFIANLGILVEGNHWRKEM